MTCDGYCQLCDMAQFIVSSRAAVAAADDDEDDDDDHDDDNDDDDDDNLAVDVIVFKSVWEFQ